MNGLFPIVASLVLLVDMTLVMLQRDWLLTMQALSVYPLLDECAYQRGGYTAAHERESAIYCRQGRSPRFTHPVQRAGGT